MRVHVIPFERTPKDGGDVGAHAQVGGFGLLDHGLETLQGHVDGAVEVLLGEGLGGGGEDGDFEFGELVVAGGFVGGREGLGVLLKQREG